MKNSSLAALAALAAGLVLTATFDPWQKDMAPPPGRVLGSAEMASLQRLVITRSDSEAIELVRVGEAKWHVEAPDPGPSDSQSVRRLLSALSLLRASRHEGVKHKHGLGKPAVTLDYESAEGRGTLGIGARSGNGKSRWLQKGAEALLVEDHLVAEILEASEHLLSQRVLWWTPESQVSRPVLAISRGTRTLRAREDMVSWTGSTEGPVEGREVRAAVSQVKALRDALRGLEFRSRGTGACPESRQVTVLEQGEHRSEIRECGPCAEADLIHLSADERHGCVSGEAWRAVQGVMDAPTTLVDLHILPERSPTAAFTIQCGGDELALAGKRLQESGVVSWWRRLDASGRGVAKLEALQPHCSITLGDAQINFGTSGAQWYARGAGDSFLRALNPAAAELLRADETAFADLQLIARDAIYARRIEVIKARGPAGKRSFQRGELLGVWASAGLDEEAATGRAEALSQVLAHLRAERFANERERRKAFKKPGVLDVSIEFEAPLGGEPQRYEIRFEQTPVHCLAQVNQLPIAIVDSETCEGLF